MVHWLLGLAALLVMVGGVSGEGPFLVARSAHKHLVLDSRVVESAEGLRLVLGRVEKDPRNPLFRADKPWENALNNLYPNVHYDEQEKRYRLWYKCVLNDKDVIARMMPPATIHDQGWFLLYATSRDGLAWEKPELGLHGFDGSTKNNAVARDTPNAGVFRDPHEADPARRYKLIYDVGLGKMRVRFSPDGLRWSEPVEPQGLTPRTGDTHNNAFWDERLGRYVLITRFFLGERLVARYESRDFTHWEDPRLVLRSTLQEGKRRQAYCMPSFPYANVYLGLVMMYNAGSDRTVDCELTWSPDSVHWQRVLPGTPFIPRGADGACDSRCIYGPAGPAVAQDDKLLIYYGGSDVPHVGWKRHCLPCLARLRLDGFAAYEPSEAGRAGTLVTQPMLAAGEPLRISADAAGGSIRVAVLDEAGFELANCEPATANVTDKPLRWRGGADAARLKGQVVRLAFEIQAARLYAFSGLALLPGVEVSTGLRHFDSSLQVSLSAPGSEKGTVIRYTLDNSDPAAASPACDAPIRLERTVTLKARAFFPGQTRGGPLLTEVFTKRTPWAEAYPGQPMTPVVHTAHFDRDAEGWQAEGTLTHHAAGGRAGGYLAVSRPVQFPFVTAGANASGGVFMGDWRAKFGGSGARISFWQRSAAPGGTTRTELFAGDIAQWSFGRLPGPGKEWAEVSTVLRFDWNDAEAEAAGWQRAMQGFSWQETIRCVGRLVVMPCVAGEPMTCDLDELTVSTSFE